MNRALCLLLAVLGALLAAAAQVDRPATSSTSRGALSVAGAADKGPPASFRIITYNVQFLPGFAAWANRRPHTSYRAREIGRRMGAFDIIALNEVFDDLSRRRLLEAVRAAAPGPVQEVASQEPGDHLINAGLMIVTRFAIVATHQLAYTQGSSVRSEGLNADGFAAKGVLHARLELPVADQPGHTTDLHDAGDTRHVDIFVTHLESRDAAIRASQCDELGRFIADHRVQGNDAILVGDFNVRGPDHGQSLSSPEYDALLAALNPRTALSPFQDVWLTHGAGPGGTSEQTTAGAGRRIDYILHAAGDQPLGARSILVNPYADPRTEALSDHSAVEAVFEWR
jgi:endonuclease/exonuclease/phosphatase family metal-dependent hydrolase